ncbi:hypothetical protein N333_11141, partial [Nestor notabilis]
LTPWRGNSPEFHAQQRGSMGCPFPSLWWDHWQQDPLLSGTSQKPDEWEPDVDEEGSGGIRGKILLYSCAGFVIICLVCCAQILQKVQSKRLCSDKRESNSTVPRNPTCSYYSRVSAWLFLSNIFNGISKRCIRQLSGPPRHSGTTTAGYSCNQRQERWFPKLSQEPAQHRYSYNNSNMLAPSRKVNKVKAIPCGARRRQRPGQEQRDSESCWIREEPCGHCKTERTRQWLSQHFSKPVSAPPEKLSSLEEEACPRRRV